MGKTSSMKKAKKAKKSSRKYSGGRVGRVRGYHDPELMHLLHVIKQIVPCVPSDWDLVSKHHNHQTNYRRSTDLIRKKWRELERNVRGVTPIGTPTMTDIQKETKLALHMMKHKAEIAGGDTSDC